MKVLNASLAVQKHRIQEYKVQDLIVLYKNNLNILMKLWKNNQNSNVNKINNYNLKYKFQKKINTILKFKNYKI